MDERKRTGHKHYKSGGNVGHVKEIKLEKNEGKGIGPVIPSDYKL